MEHETKATPWQGWTLFALRWGVMVVVSLIILPTRQDSPDMLRDLAIPFVLGAAVNLLLAAFLFFPAVHRFIPFVSIPGDLIITALYVNLAFNSGNSLLLIGVVSVMIILGLFHLGGLLGGAQASGVLLVAFSVIGYNERQSLNVILAEYGQPLLFLLAIGTVSGVWAFILEYRIRKQHREMHEVATSRAKQVSDIRERTRAMYEMASTLSTTLNYQKILDALLDVGRFSMREQGNQRMASMVLLYRSGDNALQIATSRGLRHVDEARIVHGESGIIGEALIQCIPIIGKDANKDAELQYFVAFQGMRSTLCIPLRAGFNNFGVLVFGCDSANAFNEESIEMLTAISTQATIALQNAVLYRNVLEEKERIIEVEEDARKKLARDLHDGPTQTISAIAMRMSYIYRLLERSPEQVPTELKKVEELARNTTKEIRNLLFGLRPLVLESQGLTAALNQLSEKMKDTFNQAVAIRVARDVEPYLDSHQQGVLFYIAEEAVNNARKHAEAQLISVTVQRRDQMVIMQIADNGVGFDLGAVDANYDKRGSLGMVNMRERAELIEGTLRVESAEGRGTSITITIPLKEGQLKRAQAKSSVSATTKLAAETLKRVENTTSQR
ncbi:MAG: GAF domain-containing protein [Chloroflexi bacterium]|nr:GAF domain-containing protein [Chloroflexota bacterium]